MHAAIRRTKVILWAQPRGLAPAGETDEVFAAAWTRMGTFSTLQQSLCGRVLQDSSGMLDSRESNRGESLRYNRVASSVELRATVAEH